MFITLLAAALLEIQSPAAAGSVEPYLATDGSGHVVMSWLEPPALKFARFDGTSWSAPKTIAKKDVDVSWANTPSIEASGNILAAQWPQGPGARVVVSHDGGATWTAPTLVRHEFAALAPRTDGVDVVSLDGEEGATYLRATAIDANGHVTSTKVIDARVCDCCQTAVAGKLIAYRDRSDAEIRDIAVIRGDAKPVIAHHDQWKINGCPVNGPQLDTHGQHAVLAWFTAANEKPRVKVAFSNGANFADPIRVDEGKPLGRVDVVLMNDNSAFVVWVEPTQIVARRVTESGKLDPIIKLAGTTGARSAGSPRATRSGEDVFVAFTDTTTKRVRVVKIR